MRIGARAVLLMGLMASGFCHAVDGLRERMAFTRLRDPAPPRMTAGGSFPPWPGRKPSGAAKAKRAARKRRNVRKHRRRRQARRRAA